MRDGYVANGHFQIPLFKGKFPAQKLMLELRNNDPWKYVNQLMTEKGSGIEWAGSCSLLYRLLDVQMEVIYY